MDSGSQQDLTGLARRILLLIAARSGDHERLPIESAGATAALAGWPREVVIDHTAASQGDTALHAAAAGGDGDDYLETARKLVCDTGSRHLLVACNGDGDTPLHCAARAGNSRMVSRLIHLAGEGGGEMAKAMVRTRNQRGETALHEAIRGSADGEENEGMIQALMAVDHELARVAAYDGTSPLFLAISLGHWYFARDLHTYDNALSYSGPEGRNALHAAVLHGFQLRRGMTRALLDWNVDLARQPDDSGSTPLHFAASAEEPSRDLSLFLFGEGECRETWLFASCAFHYWPKKTVYNHFKLIQHPTFQLLDATPNAAFQPDRNGSYPLHVAASAGSFVPTIILLCHSPGCAGLRDAQGRTFLHVAVEKKMHNIVKYVASRCRLEYKPILNIQDHDGNTAMHLAVLGGDWGIFKRLMSNPRVRLSLANKDGRTPMDIALSKVPPVGFYFGLHARRRILQTLTLAHAEKSNCRRDRFIEEHVPKLNEDAESEKITSFAQIVGIGSVLVATATFAAAFTMPGSFSSDSTIPPHGKAGTPTLAGFYAFDAFVISNTLAFICSSLATFSLVYTGVAALDIQKRFRLVAISLALLISAARTFCAAFAFAVYAVLAPSAAHRTGIAACVMTALALMDAVWFMEVLVTDTLVLISRDITWRRIAYPRIAYRLSQLGRRLQVNIIYVFWPYIVIFGLLAIKRFTGTKN